MKGLPFARRLGFALAGLQAAWRSEASFRTHVRAAAAMAGVLVVIGPSAVWVAVTIITVAVVLALEAANAALEALADALHPEHYSGVGRAKDMAAAAVLIASTAAAGIGVCLVYSALP